MADNSTQTGTDTLATDDITGGVANGVKVQRVKTGYGDDGEYLDVNSSTPLPVTSAVTSVVPGTGATSLGKAVDSVAGATDTGVPALFVRDDALTTLTPADGDYTHGRVTSTGALHVFLAGGAITGATDDAAVTPATQELAMIGGFVDETASDAADEGDAAMLRATADRHLRTVAVQETGAIKVAGVNATVKYAAIAASTSGNNTLVAAVSSKKVRVVFASFIANGTVNAKFQSGASGTDLTGLYYMVANSGAVLPFNEHGWFETASNTLLNLNLSGAIAVGGCLGYIEV
jgi:hypothetical protein